MDEFFFLPLSFSSSHNRELLHNREEHIQFLIQQMTFLFKYNQLILIENK